MPATILDTLAGAARDAETAEAAFRQEAAARIAVLETDRAFAYRRLNCMRAVTDAVAGAENEEDALARARTVLGERLGWSGDDEGRNQVLSRFDAVARAVFAAQGEMRGESDVADALQLFEAWYLADRGRPFWVLFEQSVVELPLVEC